MNREEKNGEIVGYSEIFLCAASASLRLVCSTSCQLVVASSNGLLISRGERRKPAASWQLAGQRGASAVIDRCAVRFTFEMVTRAKIP